MIRGSMFIARLFLEEAKCRVVVLRYLPVSVWSCPRRASGKGQVTDMTSEALAASAPASSLEPHPLSRRQTRDRNLTSVSSPHQSHLLRLPNKHQRHADYHIRPRGAQRCLGLGNALMDGR
jgi:hypothetical protein